MPKKVLHIIIGLNVGGAELMLKRLVLHSQRKGEYQHEVISLTDLGIVGSDLRKQGISVYTLGMTSIFGLPFIFLKLKKLIKQIDPDVVQTWMYHADFLGGLAAKQSGIDNIIWGIRTTDVTQGASRLTILLRSLCAKLSCRIPKKIVCAAHVSKELHEKVGYDASKMVVIPNGFELDKLVATEEDRRQLRQELNLLDTDIVIGSVGRFNEVKNQRLFVEVAALLVKDFPNLKFMMVGRDNDENNQILIEWLQEYSLLDNFRLLGQRSDIPKCLKTMDIFCLHSKTEGFPNVLGEAMYQERVCLALDVGDSKQLLPEALIIDKFDAESLSKKIQEILQYSDDKSMMIGAQLKGIIERRYSMDDITGSYHLLYGEILRGKCESI
ncbi:glycosyltransferase family 4 protein [Acinetobacter haemolyticus]|uniref:glycosyltransferase family 4 protein n=1 Tax=Acinetobacter haemolyticus TaxID=29430 RepID=UPI000375AA0F|nr:glycosyltransferase [Acinetobacter haemolyticus]